MALINARRIVKPILKTGNIKELEFKAIVADSTFKTEYLIPTITKNEFSSLNEVEKYFKHKGVYILPWVVKGDFSYQKERNNLVLTFDLSDCYYVFNMVIIISKTFDKYYVFDVKDIKVEEMINVDGLEFNYIIW